MEYHHGHHPHTNTHHPGHEPKNPPPRSAPTLPGHLNHRKVPPPSDHVTWDGHRALHGNDLDTTSLNPVHAGVRSNSLPGHTLTIAQFHTDHQTGQKHSCLGGGRRPGLSGRPGLETNHHSPPRLEGSASWHAQRDARIAERRRHRLAAMSPPPGGERYIWGHIGRIRRYFSLTWLHLGHGIIARLLILGYV